MHAAEPKKPSKALMAALPVALLLGGLAVWSTTGGVESTENAALRQARIAVAAQLSGRVSEVLIADSTEIKQGAPLFRLDPAPFAFALAQADAALAQARLTVAQLRAAYALAKAQESLAADEAAYQKAELARQTRLTANGAGTESALDAARHDAASADESLIAAEQSVAAARAALGGDPAIKTEAHPAVMAAQTARDTAAWQLAQTTVTAPADGFITQAASFKAGQFVTAGSALFTLVETKDLWVEANFKETQLENLARGQSAEITFDSFPDRHFTAKLDAIGAGTGAEFALLPAQNATGNWVKVTQRVPVKLRFDPEQDLSGLRAGLSASVDIRLK